MTAPLKILVVDDDRDGAEGLAELIAAFGHNTHIVYSGEAAVERFEAEDFDIAFMDVRMPGMNGVEAFLKIRKRKPDAKVMLVTGYSVERLLQDAIDNGVLGVLHKPVDLREVLHTLETVQPRGVVLVAEDDPDFAATVSEYLQEHGYRVILACTGQAAIEAAGAADVDVLVLDLKLPVIHGLEVYLRLREMGRSLPTIMITGYSQEESAVAGVKNDPEITGILVKPFEPQQLLDALKASLR